MCPVSSLLLLFIKNRCEELPLIIIIALEH
jgi:hypothetical protein